MEIDDINSTKQVINKLHNFQSKDSQNQFPFRIFSCGIGMYQQTQFLNYISGILRGKSINLYNLETVFEELSMLLTNININIEFNNDKYKFNENKMLYPILLKHNGEKSNRFSSDILNGDICGETCFHGCNLSGFLFL